MIFRQIEAAQHVIVQATPSRVTFADGRWCESTRPSRKPRPSGRGFAR
jgi:hypothetical protein